MRWHSLTPAMASKSAGSKSSAGPTPPSTVCTTPVERWTVKPIETRRLMTEETCSSLAPCCMTTSILSVSLACAFAIAILQRPHFVDDAFEHALHGVVRQRTAVGGGHVAIDIVFAARFVDGHVGGLLGASDFLRRRGALIQQLH